MTSNQSIKPVIVYVDDEPNNLTVFEAAVPDGWDVRVFDNPVTALGKLDEIKPWVVVSDQRMPTMKGVQLLELAKKIVPQAVRIIVTGFSEEELIIESVRKAGVFDYIRKPWDVKDLVKSLERAIEFHQMSIERERLFEELNSQKQELQDKTNALLRSTSELEKAVQREKEMSQELESWVPPFVLWALKNPEMKFPIRKSLVGITFDIIGSSRIHGVMADGKPIRARVIELFSEAILRNGGWRESHAGDSAYAHFGLLDKVTNPCGAALAAAREFRVSLRGLAQRYGCEIECGIALHIAKEAVVEVHSVQLSTPNGPVKQKSFDTTSSEIDLLHRIEKLTHKLPGSNIIMTEAFVQTLSQRPEKLVDVGRFLMRGQDQETQLYLIASDLTRAEDLEQLRQLSEAAKQVA